MTNVLLFRHFFFKLFIMNTSVLINRNIDKLVNLLINKETKLLNIVSYDLLKEFEQNDISLFCHKFAIYQIPTLELIEFLKLEIKNLNAIEIGCGNGAIGRNLNIPITDNKIQERDDIKLFYLINNQPIITYPKDVIHLNGNDATDKYKPEAIIASWVTGTDIGNYYGIDEIEILKSENLKKYIHIGNELTHGNKNILKEFNYRIIKEKWLISRSMSRDKNVIYIFDL